MEVTTNTTEADIHEVILASLDAYSRTHNRNPGIILIGHDIYWKLQQAFDDPTKDRDELEYKGIDALHSNHMKNNQIRIY